VDADDVGWGIWVCGAPCGDGTKDSIVGGNVVVEVNMDDILRYT